MKKENRKNIVRIVAVVLALLFVAGIVMILAPTSRAAQAQEDVDYILEELDVGSSAPEPIPLICIRISFDANGNGVDDYSSSDPTKLYSDKSSDAYGEQWIGSSAWYWSNMLFGKTGKTLYNYYSELTGGKFYFYAGEETQGTKNDGIVDVAVKLKHPRATLASNTADGGERRAALEAANEYIDFKSYDKNGNGYIDYSELAIVFVLAGYEHAYSSSRPSSKVAFGTHAHYTSGAGVMLDGVYVTASGHSGFVKCGEYMSASTALTVGTVAHELGHFLGAYDIYDGSGSWTGYTSNMSLMSSGSHLNASGTPRGSAPAYLDPYHMSYIGFTKPTTVRDGEYTLYSRESDEGEYNIIRISTPNPNEYYLVENRYSSSASLFDNTTPGCQGVVIWHIDEDIINSGKINTSTSGHDPGIVVLSPATISAANCAYAYAENAAVGKYTFTAASGRYRFPNTDAWYTSLDADTEFPLVIEVLDVGSPEMRIKVSGTVDCAPVVEFETGKATLATETSLTLFGKITDLNGGNVTSCGFIVSTSQDPTAENGTVVFAIPSANGTFSATIDGLSAGTKYYCRVFASGEYGTGSLVMSSYTKFPPRQDVEHDYYLVYLQSNYYMNRTYTRYLYPGQKLDYVFPFEWVGYSFCGWYWDAELTERYDMNYTQQTKDDYTLYGKWVRQENARTLSVSGARAKIIFAAEIGTTYAEPIPEERDGYEFDGWFADGDLTIPFDFSAEVKDEQLTVYAKWKPVQSDPEETTDKTTETPPETPSETTSEVENINKRNGCGSAISGVSAALTVTVSTCVCVLCKKKKSD